MDWAFASTAEGAALIKVWGKTAPRKVAAVKARMSAILGAMEAEDRAATQSWFDGLPAAQAQAVMRSLAG